MSKVPLMLSKRPGRCRDSGFFCGSVFFVAARLFLSSWVCWLQASGTAESITAMITDKLTAPLTNDLSRLGSWGLTSASLARKRLPRRVIGTVYLGVAVHTTSVEGEDAEAGDV